MSEQKQDVAATEEQPFSNSTYLCERSVFGSSKSSLYFSNKHWFDLNAKQPLAMTYMKWY